MPHRAPGSPARGPRQYLSGRPISYYRPTGDPAIRALIDNGFQAFNAGRLSEACKIFADKMLDPDNKTDNAAPRVSFVSPPQRSHRYACVGAPRSRRRSRRHLLSLQPLRATGLC